MNGWCLIQASQSWHVSVSELEQPLLLRDSPTLNYFIFSQNPLWLASARCYWSNSEQKMFWIENNDQKFSSNVVAMQWFRTAFVTRLPNRDHDLNHLCFSRRGSAQRIPSCLLGALCLHRQSLAKEKYYGKIDSQSYYFPSCIFQR